MTVKFEQAGRIFHGLILVTMSIQMDSSSARLGDAFQVNYREPVEQARARFERWLESNLTSAIFAWRERL